MADIRGQFGSFAEAVAFFRQKVNWPTATWRDVWQGQHARVFVIAGAGRDDLLADFRRAVHRISADGGTLRDFRRDFDRIVARYGWSYKGSRGWRTRVIYQTNMRTAYAAGRYRQLTSPAAIEALPFWQYQHHTLLNPRKIHRSWNGMVLRNDDVFWAWNYPPNGWGCRCTVRGVSRRGLERLGKDGPDPSPGQTTEGVPPEWRYNVGEAAFGRPPQFGPLQSVATSESAWQPMPSAGAAGWQEYGLPARLPLRRIDTLPGPPIEGSAAMTAAIRAALGTDQYVSTYRFGDFTSGLITDAGVLGRHIAKDPQRGRFVPFLPALIDRPAEIWGQFLIHKETGKVALRHHVISAVTYPGAGASKGLGLVFSAEGGHMLAWTFLLDRLRRVNKWRQGVLLYRDDGL